MGDAINDARFSHIANDPRFKSIPRSQRKVKIDKRFKAMFEDKRFKTKYTVDKRGRPTPKTSNEDLERFYDLSSGSSDSEDSDDVDDDKNDVASLKNKSKPKLDAVLQDGESDDTTSDDSGDEVQSTSETKLVEDNEGSVRSDDEELNDKIRSKLRDVSVDYARGEGAILTDSSSDEESSGDEVDETPEHGWGELDKDAERTDEVTSRLAVCNMDWDRIRAVDLMVLLNSFTPTGGLIRSVTIYPSEFGLERMKTEDVQGPTELVKQASKNQKKYTEAEDDDSDSGDDDEGPIDENEEGSSYHMEKLRKYQLNRLKYFYAIVECDSPNTANNIYTECDGMEYESSATRLDLRFVPDDTTFEQDPRETCTGMPDAGKYKPRNFTTTALQQAKVELTWDETDPTRSEIASRLMAGDTVDDKDLQAYLASSCDEENSAEEQDKVQKGKRNQNIVDGKQSNSEPSSDDEDPIAKYRSLLSGIEEDEKERKNKDVHMEISWGLGLKEKAEEAVKKKMANSKELTPFQEMMEKRKQKRLEKKKQKIQKKMQKSEDDENGGISSDDEIPSDIDMNDPYFAEEFKDMKSKPKKNKGKKKKEDFEETDEQLQSKAELELLLLDKDEPKHFNFKKIQEEETGSKSKRKARRKKGKELSKKETPEDDFKINVDDSRFSALYSSHLYNIDPTDPHFRKSNGMAALISTKQKRLADSSLEVSDHIQSAPPKKSKKDAELSLLVKSVKNKTQNLKKH